MPLEHNRILPELVVINRVGSQGVNYNFSKAVFWAVMFPKQPMFLNVSSTEARASCIHCPAHDGITNETTDTITPKPRRFLHL